MWRSLTIAVICVSAASVSAQDYASGQDAYNARDWAAAERLWSEEAAAGSSAALLGLGNLLDFGLLAAPDPEGAFGKYREAAELGNAEAAFNLGVMLDSGVGTDLDRRAAAGWYSVASLDDFPRAQFNLALMFAEGDGVPENAGLAAYWLERIRDRVPAAANALARLPQQSDAAVAAPQPILFRQSQRDGQDVVQMAWLAGNDPDGARYLVELGDAARPDATRMIVEGETEGSALTLDLPEALDQPVWRVLQVSGRSYASSPWQTADGSVFDMAPLERVTFRVSAGDPRAKGYAERIEASLARSGIAVEIRPSDAPLTGSAIRYTFDEDVAFATSLSDFLPSLSGGAPSLTDDDASLRPGEVGIDIVFQPPTQ